MMINDGQPQAPTMIGGVAIQPAYEHNIEMQSLISEWKTSKTFTDNHTKDFVSLDNIVDGVPIHQNADTPYVGDTTLAGLVREIPRQSLQQVPIFAAVINGSKKSINSHIGSYILRRAVFNQDTFGKGILSTLQIGGEQALTHGYAPFMCATGTMFDEFGTTMKLLHYSDVGVEPGIQDSNESGYFYVSAELVPSRVRKIRDAALANPETTWNVNALNRLLDLKPESSSKYDIYRSTPRQVSGTQDGDTYTFVTRYEVGKGGKFATFCPQIEEEPLRVINNRSKFGYPRLNFLVIDPAALTPFGISRVRLASPNQNLMNAYYANVAAMFILNSDPPILQRGRFTTPVQLKPRAKWIAQDQNATAELVELSNGTLQQFVPMAQQMAAQIQNMMGKPVKNTDLGNTSPGAKQQIKYEDTSTNQMTNIMENFVRQYALVALDTWIAEQTIDNPDPEVDYSEDLIVDDECKEAINRLVPGTIGDDNVIQINWNEFYDSVKHWSVEIELSMGKDEMEEKQRGDLQDMLTVMQQNDNGMDPEQTQKIRELQDRLLEKSVPASSRLGAAQAPVQTVDPNAMTQQ